MATSLMVDLNLVLFEVHRAVSDWKAIGENAYDRQAATICDPKRRSSSVAFRKTHIAISTHIIAHR